MAGWLGRPDRLISSPLLRARQTAEAFAVPYEIDERWIELDYGSLDGVPVTEVGAESGRGGASIPTTRSAGERAWRRCASASSPQQRNCSPTPSDQTIVVTTHVSPIKAAMTWALGVDVTAGWRCHLDQASVCRIALGPKGPVLLGFNETRR